jgi:hypothetical protein
MPQRFDTQELRRQVGELHQQIPADLLAHPDMPLSGYYEELQGRHAPEAVRTALWDLISDQTLELQHPGNKLKVAEPRVN